MMIIMYGSFLDVSWSSCVSTGIRHFAVERHRANTAAATGIELIVLLAAGSECC